MFVLALRWVKAVYCSVGLVAALCAGACGTLTVSVNNQSNHVPIVSGAGIHISFATSVY